MSTNTASQPLKVAVIGGSLAGLSVAHALHAAGHDVNIYEQTHSSSLSDGGAGIVMQHPTEQILQKYNIAPLNQVSVTAKQRQYFNKHGELDSLKDYEQHMTAWGALHGAMLRKWNDVASANKFHWDTKLIDFKVNEDEGKVTATLQHGGKPGESVHGDVTDQHDSNGSKDGHDAVIEHVSIDLLIGADGQSSTTRRLLAKQQQLDSDDTIHYAGYVAWRGVVPEHSAAPDLLKTFKGKFSWFMPNDIPTHILAYLIPGADGSVQEGKRRINWVWYWNYDEHNGELQRVLKDKNGKRHRWSVPQGLTAENEIEAQRKRAHEILPPQFQSLFDATSEPFLQAVVDSDPHTTVFYSGRVLLLGDAASSVRPHTAASTSKAADDAMNLADALHHGLDGQHLERWQRKQLEQAVNLRQYGKRVGDSSQIPESGSHGQQESAAKQ